MLFKDIFPQRPVNTIIPKRKALTLFLFRILYKVLLTILTIHFTKVLPRKLTNLMINKLITILWNIYIHNFIVGLSEY